MLSLLGCTDSPANPNPQPDQGTGPDQGSPDDMGVDLSCNGSLTLCSKRYDEVAYATTHNAMSNPTDRIAPPNQQSSMTVQLEDGVRGLMLDFHYQAITNNPSLCHGDCVFGARDLAEGLGEINDFLDTHPREVITIIIENYIDGADIEAAVTTAGMLPRLVTHTPGTPWPTLQELIDADTRVVLFTDSEAGAFDGLLDVWDEAWEVPFSAQSPDDFVCTPGRGSPSNALWIFNHFLTAPLASEPLAEMVNHNPEFGARVDACMTDTGDFPNFITVDFYEIGDTLAITDRLNGVQ